MPSVCCIILQCVAEWCSVLRCVPVVAVSLIGGNRSSLGCPRLVFVVMCCSVLQCVAVCCSVLQCRLSVVVGAVWGVCGAGRDCVLHCV